MVKLYIPARGDIVKLDFVGVASLKENPTLGREQAGYRPALIITERQFNQATRLALACPVTSKAKGFNLEVILPDGLITTGVILTFQVKTIDWIEHQVKYVESLPLEVMVEVTAKLQALIG